MCKSFSLESAYRNYLAPQNGEQGVEFHVSLLFLKLATAQDPGVTTRGLSGDTFCDTVSFFFTAGSQNFEEYLLVSILVTFGLQTEQ